MHSENIITVGDSIVYNDDCLTVMNELVERGFKADLTVTSPPYDSLRSYDNKDEWNFDKFKHIASALYEITSDGGVIVWVVGDSVENGSETGSSFRQALYFKDELGMKIHDTMIYEKNSSSFPARKDSNRYTQIFEYMFVLSKGKPKTANLIIDKENKWAGYTNWGNNTQYDKDGKLHQTNNIKPVPKFSARNNIWKYTVGFNVNLGKHSAVFPFQLAEDHIRTWSNDGDMIFDPFMGSGTTMYAALKNNRKFLGCEINADYIKYYEENYKAYQKRWKSK